MFKRLQLLRLVHSAEQERPVLGIKNVFNNFARFQLNKLCKEEKKFEMQQKLKTAEMYATMASVSEIKKDNSSAVQYYVFAAEEIIETFKLLDSESISLFQKLMVFSSLMDARIYLDRAMRLVAKIPDSEKTTRRARRCPDDINIVITMKQIDALVQILKSV